MSDKLRMLTAIVELTENGKKEVGVDELMSHLDKTGIMKMNVISFEMYRRAVLSRHDGVKTLERTVN